MWKDEIKKNMPDSSVNPSVRMSRMISQKTKSLDEMMKKVGKIISKIESVAFDSEVQPDISRLNDEFQNLMFEFGSAEDFLSDLM